MMGTPSRIHQKLVGQLSRIIGNYIESNHGSCEIYPAPCQQMICSVITIQLDILHMQILVYPCKSSLLICPDLE